MGAVSAGAGADGATGGVAAASGLAGGIVVSGDVGVVAGGQTLPGAGGCSITQGVADSVTGRRKCFPAAVPTEGAKGRIDTATAAIHRVCFRLRINAPFDLPVPTPAAAETCGQLTNMEFGHVVLRSTRSDLNLISAEDI